MFRFMLLPAVLTLLSLLPAGGTHSEQPTPSKTKTVRLLTVGNSFSQNATRYLGDLVKAKGHTLIHRPLAVGGASLEVHWEKAQRHEKDPRDPRGLYGKKSLREELLSGAWDYVTIQQASIKSHDVATYRPFARQLHDYIKRSTPKAEILVHQTWAYRVDDPRFAKPSKTPGEPSTQKEMYEGLTGASRAIAGELGARVIPVGDAMYLADTNAKWGYRPDQEFDLKNAQPPSLPDQTHSLHTGWRWAAAKGGKKSLTMDGHHASVAGQYLAACVFYEVLFAESVVGNSFVPQGLDREYARFLQETAHQAVVKNQERGERETKAKLSRALTLHVSFDKGFDADYSRGEKKCYVQRGPKLVPAQPNEDVKLAAGAGRFGGALHFPKKGTTRPSFKDGGVLGYNARSWSASVSAWLRLNPDQDLEPGYCDPIQIIGDDNKKGYIFLEWSKDETPRYFRYAVRPLFPIWNPKNLPWADIPADKKPMVEVARAPFSREKWTHVVFTLENINDKKKSPVGRLFLNGKPQGAIEKWDLTFAWDPAKVLLVLGANYVGYLDDLAVFDHPLTDVEVAHIYGLKDGIRELYR
jgi:hypothetical protein